MRRAVYVAMPEVAMLAQFPALRNYFKVSLKQKTTLWLFVVFAPLVRGVGGVENPKPDKVMVWVGGVGTSTHAPTPQPLYGGGSSALAEKP